MLIVGIDVAAVEADLVRGRICCPSCEGGLRPWGHGASREVRLADRSELRRPRRSICRACAATHVLVPEDTLLRRRDGVEVIGAALVAKAQGQGHRSLAPRAQNKPGLHGLARCTERQSRWGRSASIRG